MRVFITGIAGFIGSNVANRLHELGYLVYGVDNLKNGNTKNLIKDIIWDNIDLGSVHEDILNSYDALLHFACDNIRYSQDFPVETFKTNSLKSIQLINKFRGKIVYTSTSSVYGQASFLPTRENNEIILSNAYDQSKYIAELFLRKRKNFSTLRLSNVYGINQRYESTYPAVIPKFINLCNINSPITIYGSGNDTRDFTYIDDVVEAIITTLELKSLNTEINIGTSEETSINQVANLISKITGKDIKTIHVDSQSVDGIKRRCLDNKLAFKKIGWKPKTSFHDGLLKTIKWMTQ